MILNNKKVKFVVDTGCPVTLVSEEEGLLLDESKRRDVKCRLSSYTGHNIDIMGIHNVQVSYENQNYNLPVYVVRGKAPALLGRNWIEKI